MNPRIETILVGTSLSAASDAVVAKALELARSLGARLHVAHAYAQPSQMVSEPLVPWVDPLLAQSAETAAREGVHAQLARVGADPAREVGEVVVKPGPADQALLDAARELRAGLLLVGSVEPGHRLARLLGSTADRLIREASCPVLVVRGEMPVPPARVLLPVDLSPLSAHAFRQGMDFLRQIPAARPAKAEALLVLVPYPRQMPFQFSAGDVQHMVVHELERFVRRAGGDPAAADVWTNLRTGEAGTEILAELHEWPADLAIVGTHGYSGFRRFLLGSVASLVAQQAPCSVLVLPPRAVPGALDFEPEERQEPLCDIWKERKRQASAAAGG